MKEDGEYLWICKSYRNVMVLKIEVQSTRNSFLTSVKSCRTIFTPCRIEFQCTMSFGSPDYTISSWRRSRLKGHSPYKKVDFSAQIVGSNPIVQCTVGK